MNRKRIAIVTAAKSNREDITLMKSKIVELSRENLQDGEVAALLAMVAEMKLFLVNEIKLNIASYEEGMVIL